MMYDISSLQLLEQFAKDISSQLRGGEVLALVGDLGAGKTTFTQLLCKELGVVGIVNSPTFVVAKEYATDNGHIRHIVHMDAYRITHPDEVLELGIDRHLNQQHSLVVIEWANKIREYLDKQKKVQWLMFTVDGEKRSVEVR